MDFMKIYSAPLQGFTEAVWRNVHSSVFGNIDGYYTPFLRYEHGEIRSKDIRDVERKNNCVENLVPQIIAATPEEMHPLMELIAGEGYSRVDINMGCSFALQVRKCHGAGLLPHPDKVEALMKATEKFPEISFSVKNAEKACYCSISSALFSVVSVMLAPPMMRASSFFLPSRSRGVTEV